MQKISEEIINFVESISQRELIDNSKIKQDIANLIESLIDLPSNNTRGILKYLNKEMLISK